MADDQDNVAFIECGTLNINYNIMGIATITYTMISDSSNLQQNIITSISAGGQTFNGVIINANMRPLQGITGESGNTVWYSTNVTLIATSDGTGGDDDDGGEPPVVVVEQL